MQGDDRDDRNPVRKCLRDSRGGVNCQQRPEPAAQARGGRAFAPNLLDPGRHVTSAAEPPASSR